MLGPSLDIDGQQRPWELLSDGRTLRLSESLPPQRHWVGITPWAVKPPVLAGRYRKAYIVDASRGDHVAWSLRDANDLRLAAEASLDEDGVSYRYDAADNLIASSTRTRGVEATRSFPLDGSGRNRPSEVNGTPLEWDANGNLKRRGSLTFSYDARNRPVAARLDGVERVRFEYDPFNRLVRTSYADGRIYEKTWDGWQDIETYANDQLVSRRIYGQGLDEIVRQDVDLDGDGTLDSTQFPIRDSSGNVVVLTDAQGRTVERYDYTPFGQQTIRVDTTPPSIDSVSIVVGLVEVVFSEAIDAPRALAGATAGRISLFTASGPVAFEAARGAGQGRNAGRRLLLAPTNPIAAAATVQLRLEPDAVVDLFQKQMAEPYERTFAWAADRIVEDTSAPQLLEIRLRDGKLEFEFTERLDPSQAALATTLDDQPVALVASSDGLTLSSATPLPTGPHRLKIATTLADLAGNHLAAAFDEALTIGATDPNRFVYLAPDPEVLQASAAGNVYGFQAREKEPVTGWIYLRNRWYDPELGRFVTADPLGYADGPNRLAYAGNDPVNRGDPLGLYAKDFHQGITQWLARLAGFSPREARQLGFFAQLPDEDESRAPVLNAVPLILNNSVDPSIDAAKRLAAQSLRKWHFPLSLVPGPVQPSRQVVPGSAAALVLAQQGIDFSDLATFGQGLHVAEDSFAHQGEPIWTYRWGPGSDEFAMFGHPLERRGPSTATDDPSVFPDTALQAMRETFRLMVEFRQKRDRLSGMEIVALWDRFGAASKDMVEFVNLPTDERFAWLRRQGIFVGQP